MTSPILSEREIIARPLVTRRLSAISFGWFWRGIFSLHGVRRRDHLGLSRGGVPAPPLLYGQNDRPAALRRTVA